MNVGSLFSGIGGFDLGFERAGMRVSWQVEQDPYCRDVLARHFPAACRYERVEAVGAQNLPPVDLVCGGFPCQDLSVAGNGAGLDGARSGLWSEFARIVCELRPRYVVVENVPALLTGKGKRWARAPIGRVLGDLAEVGYDAEWACLSAREFGAPHLRKRVWIVAYPQGFEQPQQQESDNSGAPLGGAGAGTGGRVERRRASARGLLASRDQVARGAVALADPPRNAEARPAAATGAERQRARPGGAGSGASPRLADADRDRREEGLLVGAGLGQPKGTGDAVRRGPRPRGGGRDAGPWAVEPDVGRVADGVPDRVDRLAALGNALVPQIAEWIGGRILEFERRHDSSAAALEWMRR